MLNHLFGGIVSAEQGLDSPIRRWFNQIFILVFLLSPLGGAAYAFSTVAWNPIGWKELTLLGSLYLATGLGITIGYHRMLTHRSFDAHPVIKFILLVFGTWSIQGSPLMWAAIHSKHHVHSDTEQDPHSPTKSFFHSHMGWMLTPFRADPERYAKAAMQDPVVMFVSRTTFWWAVLGCLIPYFVAGWEGFLWGTLVRVFVVHHVTWSVNSICHTFGSRPYATGRDLSTNNWIVGLLAMGEGWHNNHHAFPKSAFHGLHWKQFDLSGQVIRAMGTLRLAREICTIPRDVIEARKTRLARAA